MKQIKYFLYQNLPKNWQTWKKFTLTVVPVIFSSLIFALNSFVDNFMSINIAGANQALAYANGWTEIQLGIISTTTVIGTALFSQYVGKKDWERVKEVINIRMLFAIGICLIFVIPCLIFPKFMINVISAYDDMSENIRNQAEFYLRIISVSWLLNAWSFTLVMILREKNHGVISVISSVITVAINIVLNSIFVFGLNYGIEFLAYSTIISFTVDAIFLSIWIWIKERILFINIFKIFKISSHIAKQFFKRIWSFILFALGSITINIRFIQWNKGYGTGSIGLEDFRLSSASILGITGMFFNIFWTTFESLNATVAVYVGRELGNNNIEQAKQNAKELQGFHLIVGLIIGTIAVIFSLLTEKMTFLADGYIKELEDYYQGNPKPYMEMTKFLESAKLEFLKNIKWTLFGISIFIPLFVWFVSRDRIIAIGGLTNIVALIEALVGIFQTLWLTMICFGLVHLNVSFAWAYFIFFLSDIPKLIVYEIVYFKVNWARNITHNETID